MEGLRKKDRDKKSQSARKKYPSNDIPHRRRAPSLHDTNLNKSRQTRAPPNGGNTVPGTGYPAERSFSRSSVLASPSVLVEQSRVSSSAKHGPEKLAADMSDYVHDTSVWEAMEIRFLDKGKCTVLRPNLSSVLSSAEASATSHSSAKNSNPSAVVYPRAHLLNAPLPIRRQKVCVEKVHVRNLLNTKREKCGNLSSSRLSEYMPHISDAAARKKCDNGVDEKDISRASKSTSSCVSVTESLKSVSDINVLRSMEDIACNEHASFKTVKGPDNPDQITPRSQSTPGYQKCSTISRSRDSNEVVDANESPGNHLDYGKSLDGISSQTDKKEVYHVNQLKYSPAIGSSAFFYRRCSNLDQGKGSKFDLTERWANQECSAKLSLAYPQSMRHSPSRCKNDQNSSSDEEHSSADCCISPEKPTCQTRRLFAKNPSFGSAESSYEYVSNKLCPSDTRSTPAKRYTGSDKTSDLFTSNISSEAWIKHCTGCFPKDKDDVQTCALKSGATTKKEASHQSADRDSTEFSEQATTTSGTSKTKVGNKQPLSAAPNTPSAVENYSGESISSTADKTSFGVASKPKDKGDLSVSMNGAKSSASSFSPLSEAEIARYKEIALEILMQRKKNQRRGADMKVNRDYSVIPINRKKRQSSAQLKKVKSTEKPAPTKPASKKKTLPGKVEKQRSSSTGRLPQPESVNDRTIFWASQRIRNQIEKHKQRLLQTNKAKTKPAREGVNPFSTRRTDVKTSSTTTSNQSNTDHKDNENPKDRTKIAVKPMLSTVTSEMSLTVTSATAVDKRPDKKMSLLSLDEDKPKQLEPSQPPGFKTPQTTGTTTEWSPGKSDWASSVNVESDSRFAGSNVMAMEAQTDDSVGQVVSECKSGDTGPVNSKLMYLDKLDFKDDTLNYAKELPPPSLAPTQKGGKAKVGYEYSAQQTTPRLPQEDTGATDPGSMQSAQPTRYLDLLHNILKSPTSKTTQALSMFLQKPRALAEAERDLDITVDQIISSYQGIFEELRNVPSKRIHSSDRPTVSSTSKKSYTPYKSSTLAGEDHFTQPVITCSTSSCERFSKICCTKYDSASLECRRNQIKVADLPCGNESREDIKCNVSPNRTTPQSCKSSKFNVAIVSGRSVSRKFSGASPAPNDYRLGSASLHSELSTPKEHTPVPRKQSSFSNIKANKPPNLDSTNYGFFKPSLPSSRKPYVMACNKTQSQLSVEKKNSLKMDKSKRPVKVSSQISSRSNAFERPFLERQTPTSKPTIQSLKKKCVSLNSKGSLLPTSSKSATGDYCPKYQRDLAKRALEKENSQFELLLQSFQQNLLTAEHETLAMQHTRPAITIIAPQACLNISSTVMHDAARNKEADSEKSTSTKKSFTDIHLLESHDKKRHSMDSFLQVKQGAGQPVVCKTRRIKTFPLCRREIKKTITAPLPRGRNEVKTRQDSTHKSIEPPPRKNYLRKESSLSALSVRKEVSKGNPRLALQATAKSSSVLADSGLTSSEHTIIRTPSNSSASHANVHVKLTTNASVVQLRESSSSDCAMSAVPGLPNKEQDKKDSAILGQKRQSEDAQLTKSDTDNYVVQVISSTKSSTNFENGPFSLDKSGAVNKLKVRQTKSVTKTIPRRPSFRKPQVETKGKETKLRNQIIKTKSGTRQSPGSSLQQNLKEATRSASASSFNERGKTTLIPRRQRTAKNLECVARKKSLPNAKSPRSASCPPEHQGRTQLQNSSDAKEVSEDLARESQEKLRAVDNNFIPFSTNIANECDNIRESLEILNSRRWPQKDEEFKKSIIKLDERNICLKEENEMPPKLPAISTIRHSAVHGEYSSEHEVKAGQTSSSVPEKSNDQQETMEPDIVSPGPAAEAVVIPPSDTIERTSSQSNVQIVPVSINSMLDFSPFPLINKRSYEEHVDSRYVTNVSEKWPGRPVITWKQPGSEEDSESEGLSLQAMRRQAVARTCEMIIRESKNSDKNKAEYTGDLAAINKLCNLHRSAETCLGLKTPTKWWPPELLSKTGWLMSSLRTEQEHNLGTKSTLSQDTLDSLAPINAETGEEDEESVDFLKSISSLKMCCKTQIMKDLIPIGLCKYIDSDSTQEDNVRLLTTTDDHTEMYSPALTGDESADKKERASGVLLNDKIAPCEEPKECFKARGLPTPKCNQQFNVNLQPNYFPLIESCNEKMDYFSESPLIQSSFEPASCALKIHKWDGAADVDDSSSPCANSSQAGLNFPNQFQVDPPMDDNEEDIFVQRKQNKMGEAVAAKETLSTIGENNVACLTSHFMKEGSVQNSRSKLDKMFCTTESHEEKFAQSIQRELVEMSVTFQEDIPPRLQTVEDVYSPRTKSASDTKKSMTTDSFSSALNQEGCAPYIDVAYGVPFTQESKSSSLQFETHPLEQTSGEEIQDIILKEIKNQELLTELEGVKQSVRLLAKTNVSVSTQAPERCQSTDDASISSREYSIADVKSRCGFPNLPDAVNEPLSSCDDFPQHRLTTALNDWSLLSSIKTPEDLLPLTIDTADAFIKLTEQETGNSPLEVQVDTDMKFKDGQCQTLLFGETERGLFNAEFKDPVIEQETSKFVTKWTMTSEQETSFDRVTPTLDVEKVVSVLEESPFLQATVSLSVESENNLSKESLVGEDFATCLHGSRQCPNSLQNYLNSDCPCVKADTFWDNNAGLKVEPLPLTRVCRKPNTRTAERTTARAVTAQEVKMRIRIELSGDSPCKCNKLKEPSEDDQSCYPCCSLPVVFNPNRDSVQELTLHLGPRSKFSAHRHQHPVEAMDHQGSDRLEKHGNSVESTRKIKDYQEMPSFESESPIRTISNESQQSLVPTPHSPTEEKLSVEDFYDTGLTSKAVSDFDEVQSFKVDSFRGLPAMNYDHDNLNVFSEKENLYSCASKRASAINDDSVYVDRSQRIFYSGVSPDRCYRLHHTEEELHPDSSGRATLTKQSKDVSGPTSTTNKSTPKRDVEKYYTSTRHQASVKTPCESLKHLGESKTQTNASKEDKLQTIFKGPKNVQLPNTANENSKDVEILSGEPVNEPVALLSLEIPHIASDPVAEPQKDALICCKECDSTIGLKSDDGGEVAVETKESNSCIRKLSRMRKINENLIQQKVAENLEMFIQSMKKLKLRQTSPSPICKPSSRSCKNNLVLLKQKSLPGDTWAGSSTPMSSKIEMTKSASATSKLGFGRSLSSSTGGSFYRLNIVQSSCKSPPKTEFIPRVQQTMYPSSNAFNCTSITSGKRTSSLPISVRNINPTTKSSPTNVPQTTVAPKTETVYVKNVVFQSSVCLVSDASTNTDVSVEILKEFETNSESDNADTLHSASHYAFNESRGKDELIAKEPSLLKFYPHEQQRANTTGQCSTFFGFPSPKQDLDSKFLNLKQEKPRINSCNPFFKYISSNPFIANNTEQCPHVEPSLIDSSPQDYCSFMSQNGSPVRSHCNACSPSVDLGKAVSSPTQKSECTFEKPEFFTLNDLWLFARTEKRDDAQNVNRRCRSEEELLVDLPVHQFVEDISSPVWATCNDGTFISLSPKKTYLCRSLGNDGRLESPIEHNWAKYNELDPFEFPPERCDSCPKTHDPTKEVERLEKFVETRAWLEENEKYSKKSISLDPSQSEKHKKDDEPSENAEAIKFNNLCQQFSVNRKKHAHQDFQLISSCSKYKSDLKEVSPILNKSSLCMDNSDDNAESSCCHLVCSEAPLLPNNKYNRDRYFSWISESSVSSRSATRVSSVYGDEESEIVSQATHLDTFDGIEVLTYYLMATYIKVKEKVKRRFLRKNKTKHKRLYKNGLHVSDLFRGMFLSNYVAKKDRLTGRSQKRSHTILTKNKMSKYNLLKEETQTSSPGSVVSECSLLSSSTETSKQYNHMRGNVSDRNYPECTDNHIRGSCQMTIPSARTTLNMSSIMESCSGSFLHKAGELVEGERPDDKSRKVVKDSKEKILKHYQCQGDLSPVSYCESREIYNSLRDSVRLSEDRDLYVKGGQNQDENKNSTKLVLSFSKAKDLHWKPSNVVTQGLDSHCLHFQEDFNTVRRQENTERPQTIEHCEKSVVHEVFATNSCSGLEEDEDKNSLRLRSKNESENSQTNLQKEKPAENKFYVEEVIEEDEMNGKIAFQVANKIAPPMSHKEHSSESDFDVDKEPECFVKDEAKIDFLSRSDDERKRLQTHSFQAEKSPGNKCYIIQVSPLPISNEVGKGLTEKIHYDIKIPSKTSHLEELFENTFRLVQESGQYENRSVQTMSPTETADDNRDDIGESYTLIKDRVENAKRRMCRFDDKHCQTIMHIEEFNAIQKSVVKDSKCLNEDPDKSAILCGSDEDNECSHTNTKSQAAGKDASPNCKCIADEGQNAYVCCGKNNNKKLFNVFHKSEELANNQSHAAKDVECLGEYQCNAARSDCKGEESAINTKPIWPHNYSYCSAGDNFYPKLVSVDRALSPIAFENSDENLEKPSDDVEPTESIPDAAEMPFDDGSGFTFCGSPQYPGIGSLHYLQALFLLLGGAEPYPFAPNPDFFDDKEAIPDSLESDVDIKEKDSSSLVERESSEGLKIRTKGYCALQRNNKHDEKLVQADIEGDVQQEISATLPASESLGEAQDVVYPTKMFEQDYDGEIHEVVFFTKDLAGDTADPEQMQEPTGWCKEEGRCAADKQSPQRTANGDDNFPVCCRKVVPKEGVQLSPPKRRRTYPASKFGILTSISPSLQRKGDSSDRGKDKYHTCVTGGSHFRSSRENRGSVKPNSKPFSRRKMRLNQLIYTDCMDQKCSPSCPSVKVFAQPSDDKINADIYVEKKEAETPRPETVNVCNRTYSCQGHEEWVYYKNAPVDSTVLSEMQTEFNEKEGSLEALDRKVVVRSDSPFFFDDYELDTYEELGSLFTEMQESSSSVLLQGELAQDDEKCLPLFCESLPDTSASAKVSESRCSFHGQRREPNTYCTTCAATQTFLSVHHYMSEISSTSRDQDTEELPECNDTQMVDEKDSSAPGERLHGETKCKHANSSKHSSTDDMGKPAPTLTSCYTQTEPEARATDISVVNSESSKYVYFRNVLHKCMQSQSFLRYVQKIVDERIGKESTSDCEAASAPTFIPVAPKPKPRSVLGHRCGPWGLAGDQQTLLTEDVIEKRTSLSPPPTARREKLREVKIDESSPKNESCFVRMQSRDDDSTEKSSEDAVECRPVTCNTMSRRKMLSLRRLRRSKDTFVTKKILSESEAHLISSSSLIIMWSDSTERPTLENNKDETEEVTAASMTSCCSKQNLECSIPSSTSLTATIWCPCKPKATVCDKACSVVNIASSPVVSPFNESQTSLSKRKPKKKGNAENSKPCLSEPNIKFECEVESSAKRLGTPLADVKTSESTGTLTTTSVDYGRLKNILSAETKKLWKSLTRLEKNSEKCHVCRLQYHSLLTNSADRVDLASLEDERVAHENHVHEAVKAWEAEYLKRQHADICHAEALVNSKLDSIDDRSKESKSLMNTNKKANSPDDLTKLEDSSIITRGPYAKSVNDASRAEVEEPKENAFSTTDIPFKKTSMCVGVTKPETVPEEHYSRYLLLNSNLNPDKLDTPLQMDNQDYSCSDGHAKLCPKINRRCAHYPTVSTSDAQRRKQHLELSIRNCQLSAQCQTDSESTQSCSPLVVNASSPSSESSYQKLQENRPEDSEKIDPKPQAKSNTDSTSKTQSNTADYWIERLMNILHEMHQTFPSTTTSPSVSVIKPSNRSSLPGKTETQQFRGCLDSQEKKDSLTDNTASHNVCGLHKINSVTENSEGKSNLSSHSYVPSPSSETMSRKVPIEVLSLKKSTLSQQDSCKESASFSHSHNHKKPFFPDSSFLNVNSTGVVSEPLDLQRLQSLTSIASDYHVWDQVKFSNSHENSQKQMTHNQLPSLHASWFLRHSNNHTYFSSSTLHYKKYQLRKSESVPELGHISHLNKSFNAPICLDNDAGNHGSIRSVKIVRERNKSSSLVRKTRSETHKEHSNHQLTCSDKKLSKKQLKTTEENKNVFITVLSQKDDPRVSTNAGETVTTNGLTINNRSLNSSQDLSKSKGMSSHMNEFLRESERCKMLSLAPEHRFTHGWSDADIKAELCTLQVGKSNGGDDESMAKVQKPLEAAVTLREFAHDHRKEEAVNANTQVDGERKPSSKTRHHRASSCRAAAKRGPSCSSEKSLNKSSVFRDSRKTVSLKDDEKREEIQVDAEDWESVTENSKVSLDSAGTVLGNHSNGINTSTHQETSADSGLDQDEAARACLVNKKKDQRMLTHKIEYKKIKSDARPSTEAIDGSLYLKSRALLRRTQEYVENDLKVTDSPSFGTIDTKNPFFCQVFEGDQYIRMPKADAVPDNGTARETPESNLHPVSVSLRHSSVLEYAMTSKKICQTLKDENDVVGWCVENCARDGEMKKGCDLSGNLSINRNYLHAIPREVNKLDGIDITDIENKVNKCLGKNVEIEHNKPVRKDFPNDVNQLVHKNSHKEVNQLICKDCPNDVNQPIRKDCPNEVNQPIRKECLNEVNQPIRKDCPNEVNQPIRKDCPNEVNQPIRKDCPNEVNQPIRKECLNEVNQPIRKECLNEVNQPIRKDCPNEVNQPIRKDCPNEVNQLIRKDCPNEVNQLIRKDCPNEVNQPIRKDCPNEVNQPIRKDCPHEVNQLIRKDCPNEVNQLIRKDCPNEVNQPIRKDCPNEVNQPIRKDCPNEVNQLICKDCPNEVNQLIRKDCPNEVNQPIRKDCPNEVNQLICKDCPNEVNQPIRKDCPNEVNQPIRKECLNEVNEPIRKDCPNEVNQLIRKDCPNKVNQLISDETDVKGHVCTESILCNVNGVKNKVDQNICNDTNNVMNQDNNNDFEKVVTQSISKDVKSVCNDNLRNAASDDSYPPLCNDGKKEVEELFRRKCLGGENVCRCDGNEVLIKPLKDFPTESIVNGNSAVSVKVKDDTKFASVESTKKISPCEELGIPIRSGHCHFKETPNEPEARVDANGSLLRDAKVVVTEVVSCAEERLSSSRRLNRNVDLLGEKDRELKTFVQSDKKNLPIWKHWKDETVAVSAEENEVKKSSVFQNEAGIRSNVFIQNDKKARMIRNYPNVSTNQLASSMSPDKTRRLVMSEEKPGTVAVLLRTSNCEVTANCSPGIGVRSKDCVKSVSPTMESSKSPSAHGQPILFNVRLKPVCASGALWVERGECDFSPSHASPDTEDAPAKHLSSGLAGTLPTLPSQTSVDETGYSQARSANESPDNQGACLVEDSSVTTVDHLCIKYNLFTKKRHPRSPHSEPRSHNSKAERAPSVLRSQSVLTGQQEGEEDYEYEEEGYPPSEGNSTLSWEVPGSAAEASMKSETLDGSYGNETNKREGVGPGLRAALEIPVDIYTLPVRPTKKDAASHKKKKKKKKENSFTRTVVISGPLSNFSIPVHRHVSRTEDVNEAREDDLSSKKAACSKTGTASHKSLSCRTRNSFAADSPQRWMSTLRKFLPFRKKNSEKHKQMNPK